MSLRVMKAKYDSKVKLNRINSQKLFALNYSNTGNTSKKCCGFGKDNQIPSQQKSYFNYNKRAMMGLGGAGGPSSKVSNKTINHSKKGVMQVINTVKRTPNASQSSYIKNKKAYSLRCGLNGCVVKQEPTCYEVDKKNATVTKDLGFKSSSDQINKILCLRAGNENNLYESPIMPNNRC